MRTTRTTKKTNINITTKNKIIKTQLTWIEFKVQNKINLNNMTRYETIKWHLTKMNTKNNTRYEMTPHDI